MSHDLSLEEMKKHWHGTMRSYLIGFILAIVLTAASFYLAYARLFEGPALVFALVGLGIVQAVAQVVFFLHVGQEAHPKWESAVFWFMTLLLLAVVLGTLWIMFDLDNRVMAGMD